MKKRLLSTLLTVFLLTACTSNSTTTSSTSSSTSVPNTDTTVASQYAKDLAYAINNPDASFPQLTTEISDDEAAVLIKTSAGDITLKLFPKQAPLAVENFLTHAKEGYYDGVIFHRVINDFMIQGGDPKGTGMGGESIWAGKDESIDKGNGFNNEISAFLYNIRGALSMANAGPNTNGSQFFINQNTKDSSGMLDSSKYPTKIKEAYKAGGNPSLDGNYTVFGQVVDGLDIVDSIAATETDEKDKPKTAIKIETITILKDIVF
ncbi:MULTISPECIES: peptidylprolyl isomerase [unclassified Streptococcus]|uniref:peptidylprolyl isomerase n=1 Tax=unclassified Streptococcus TaxID=2608887 RepID=UPI001072604D|nr:MULTISPECIES: peptidylprolyl isomerase [unclassified Streptococcus]MBF0787183.1 peptidylprolyl isomerase [Streptococcus sp. 19428wC2_LYSM12]MCQ9212101.1 peptidylprolyl isomerase [Streptococcus sp. B01]MCQ9213430.1 peptidylprolyl isomerase [Streptococcus sp. O1]TFV05932.1 peptidylprolyl isomerase [Streptococcus sp. LYSM12]